MGAQLTELTSCGIGKHLFWISEKEHEFAEWKQKAVRGRRKDRHMNHTNMQSLFRDHQHDHRIRFMEHGERNWDSRRLCLDSWRVLSKVTRMCLISKWKIPLAHRLGERSPLFTMIVFGQCSVLNCSLKNKWTSKQKNCYLWSKVPRLCWFVQIKCDIY